MNQIRQIAYAENGGIVVNGNNSTIHIYQDRLQQLTEEPSPGAKVCPYRGLEAFGTEHAAWFAGRDDDIEVLAEAVESQPLTGLIAASGAGKSSLVYAGLIPALAARDAEHWDVFAFRPGDEPIVALFSALSRVLDEPSDNDSIKKKARQRAAELASESLVLRDHIAAFPVPADSAAQHRVLVIVDQFEELYTQSPQKDREVLIRQLLDITDRGLAKVLLTMRFDFMEEMSSKDNALFKRVTAKPCYLSKVDDAGIRHAIRFPAEAVGLDVPEELVSLLIADTENQPGFLPYLQFALRQLWLDRDKAGAALKVDAYYAMGRLKGAISRHASAVFIGLSDDEQALAKAILPRLVSSGGHGNDLSLRQSLKDFDADGQALLRKLSEPKSRLVVLSSSDETNTDEDITVEFAHEALIREWRELQDWMIERRDFYRLREKLELQAQDWEHDARSKERLLLVGQALKSAKTIVFNSARGEISSSLEGYIEQCEYLSRQRRWTLFGTVFSVAVFVGIALVIFYQFSDQRRDQMVSALGLEAQSYLDLKNPEASIERAVTSALNSWAIAPSEQAFSAAFTAARFLPLYETEVIEGPNAFATLPNEQQLAVLTEQGTLRIIDITSGNTVKTIVGSDRFTEVHALSTNERVLLVNGNRELVIFDVQKGEEVYRYLPHENVASVVVARTGTHLLATYRNEKLSLIDLSQNSELALEPGFLDRGELLGDPNLRTMSETGGDTKVPLFPEAYTISIGYSPNWQNAVAIAFDEDGKKLAIADTDGTVAVYRVGVEASSIVYRATVKPEIQNTEGTPSTTDEEGLHRYSDGPDSYLDQLLAENDGQVIYSTEGYRRNNTAFLAFGEADDTLFYYFGLDTYGGFGLFGQSDAHAVMIDLVNAKVQTIQAARLLEPNRLEWRSIIPFWDAAGVLHYFDRDTGRIARSSTVVPTDDDQSLLLSGNGQWAAAIKNGLRETEIQLVKLDIENSDVSGDDPLMIKLEIVLPGPSRLDAFGLNYDGTLLLAREISAQGLEKRMVIDVENDIAVPFEFVGMPTRKGYLFSRSGGMLRVRHIAAHNDVLTERGQKEIDLNKKIGNALSNFGTDTDSVRGFRLTKDLENMAFSIEGNTIIVVDLLSGKTRLREELPATISYFEFLHDGSRMFVGMWDNGARLFDVEAGREVWRIEDNHNYGNPVYSSDSEVFAVTRTGSTAHISGSGDGVAFVDGRSSSRLAPQEKEVVVFSNGSFHEPLVEVDDVQQLGPISLSNKGELLAYYELERGEISVLDITTRQISHKIKASLSRFSGALFNPSDDKLAFVDDDGYWQTVKVIDLNTMELVFETKVAAAIKSIAWASKADTLTWSDENGIIRIADLEQNKIVARYSVNDWRSEVEFSEGDGYLVSWSGEPIHLLPADPHKFMSELCIRLLSIFGESLDVQCSGVR